MEEVSVVVCVSSPISPSVIPVGIGIADRSKTKVGAWTLCVPDNWFEVGSSHRMGVRLKKRREDACFRGLETRGIHNSYC